MMAFVILTYVHCGCKIRLLTGLGGGGARGMPGPTHVAKDVCVTTATAVVFSLADVCLGTPIERG